MTDYTTATLPSGSVAVMRGDEFIVAVDDQAAADRVIQGFRNVEAMTGGPITSFAVATR